MFDPKVILITGASSGNGRATAQLLAQKPYRVFGTSRHPARATPIENVMFVALDVRCDDSVEQCVSAVLEQAGRIDVLVNNAGYELSGALEETSVDEARDQFETNFFGVVRMVKAVLPFMRRQRQGQIINVSSLAGLAAAPFLGMYSASKFALEGYTEALRQEIKPFNLYASLIECGFLNTPMREHRLRAAHSIQAYDPWRQRAFNTFLEREKSGPGPELVAETIVNVIASPASRLRYIIGQEARFIACAKRFLPEGLLEKGARDHFNLDRDR